MTAKKNRNKMARRNEKKKVKQQRRTPRRGLSHRSTKTRKPRQFGKPRLPCKERSTQ